MLKIENLSFWEKNEFFSGIDFLIIGGGLVGLTTAIELRQKHKSAKIVILERGFLPTGASSKNAGFTCFGSPSEIIKDLNNHTESEVIALIKQRYTGLQLLLNRLTPEAIDYQENGSFEIFKKEDEADYLIAKKHLNYLNELGEKALGIKNIYSEKSNTFNFLKLSGIIENKLEGQIDTGKMIHQLHKKAIELDIHIFNGVEIRTFDDLNNEVICATNHGELRCAKLLITTNGFATELLPKLDVKPARAQVLITKPIKNLNWKGTFHYEQGYYYFRNIGNRILLGGGRNLDLTGEETTIFENTTLIKNELTQLLTQTILPNIKVEVDYFWSGIMGVGSKKKPIIKKLSKNVSIGVRMGGMGIALGSLVGKELAEL